MYITKNKSEKDIAELEKKAEQGDANAQYELAQYSDESKAFVWYQKAAEQGHLNAQFELGNIYYFGRGVEQDYEKAFKWNKKAAYQGDTSAQHALACSYYYGNGVARNYKEAYIWFYLIYYYHNDSHSVWKIVDEAQKKMTSGDMEEAHIEAQRRHKEIERRKNEINEYEIEAAQLGDADAQYKLAMRYFRKGKIKDSEEVAGLYKEAFQWFCKAAEQGHPGAQIFLADSYYFGQGIGQDYEKSFKWYKRATEQENPNPDAQYALGYLYDNGEGVEKDHYEAVKWYGEAAHQGHVGAQYKLACHWCPTTGDNFMWCQILAERGHADAQYRLAEYYGSGYYEDVVKKDSKQAFRWCYKAALQGHADAQYRLAEYYYKGTGIEKNHKEAFKWYYEAAEQGDPNAQLSLFELYRKGEGVQQDDHEAVKWARKAAEQGHAGAQYKLAVSYNLGQGIEQNYEKAFKWCLRAAEKEGSNPNSGHISPVGCPFDSVKQENPNPDAQYTLGYLYNNGDGVEQNNERAYKWYSKASDQGHAEAMGAISFMIDQRLMVSSKYQKMISRCLNYLYNLSIKILLKFQLLLPTRWLISLYLNLGVSYKMGRGVQKDYKKSFEFFQKAAELGDFRAQSLLGVCYYTGQGVKQNIKETIKWFRKAAEQGCGDTQRQLGLHYYKGEGIEKNNKEAYIWFSLAATNGNEESMRLRDDIQKELTPETLQKAQAEAQRRQEEIQPNKQE